MAFQDPVDAVYPPANRSQQDAFGHKGQGDLDAPAFRAFPITPSQEDLPTTIRGLYIGNSGNVFCKVAGGNTTHSNANVFFYNVVAGTVLPVRMDGVYAYNSSESDISQNTTATFLVGLY